MNTLVAYFQLKNGEILKEDKFIKFYTLEQKNYYCWFIILDYSENFRA